MCNFQNSLVIYFYRKQNYPTIHRIIWSYYLRIQQFLSMSCRTNFVKKTYIGQISNSLRTISTHSDFDVVRTQKLYRPQSKAKVCKVILTPKSFHSGDRNSQSVRNIWICSSTNSQIKTTDSTKFDILTFSRRRKYIFDLKSDEVFQIYIFNALTKLFYYCIQLYMHSFY